MPSASPSTSKVSPVLSRTSPVPSPRKHNQSSPQIVEADPEEFSRRLNISSNKRTVFTSPRQPRSSAKPAKPFNPNTDPIPMRHTAEPESISDATSSSYAPRRSLAKATAHQRQLFDHRKDDPIRVSVLARPSSTNGARPIPTPKLSNDYVLASSSPLALRCPPVPPIDNSSASSAPV
jgi:hypothetical protein